MRKLYLLLVGLSGLACGTDRSSEPTETFPDAAGKYFISGDVDGDPPESSMAGTIILTQGSLTDGTLGGYGSVFGTFLANLSVSITDSVIEASVTPAGGVTFTLEDTNGRWTFGGTLEAGMLANGRHSLTLANGGMIRGNWSGVRASSSHHRSGSMSDGTSREHRRMPRSRWLAPRGAPSLSFSHTGLIPGRRTGRTARPVQDSQLGFSCAPEPTP